MRAAGWGAARGSGHRCCPTRATTRDSRIAVRRGQLLPQGAARSAATLERSPSRTRADYKPAERVGGAPKDPPETAEVTRLSDTNQKRSIGSLPRDAERPFAHGRQSWLRHGVSRVAGYPALAQRHQGRSSGSLTPLLRRAPSSLACEDAARRPPPRQTDRRNRPHRLGERASTRPACGAAIHPRSSAGAPRCRRRRARLMRAAPR
jgi:hypothetical protein